MTRRRSSEAGSQSEAASVALAGRKANGGDAKVMQCTYVSNLTFVSSSGSAGRAGTSPAPRSRPPLRAEGAGTAPEQEGRQERYEEEEKEAEEEEAEEEEEEGQPGPAVGAGRVQGGRAGEGGRGHL